jgi:hypothetical protein
LEVGRLRAATGPSGESWRPCVFLLLLPGRPFSATQEFHISWVACCGATGQPISYFVEAKTLENNQDAIFNYEYGAFASGQPNLAGTRT